MTTIKIEKYKDAYRDELIALWELSVRATHHFLDRGDIDFYKDLVKTIDFNSFEVYCAFDEIKRMVGMLGVAESKLEMLFLLPEVIGKGVGRTLMLFALNELKVASVDVNEGNSQATAFYQRFGFQTYDRTPLDDSGKPYPILKMRL